VTPAYQDIPRIYTAAAECFACFIYVFLLKKRRSRKRLVLLSVLFFAFQSILLVTTCNISNTYWIPVMIVAFLSMWAYLRLCCSGSRAFIGYMASAAFLQAELAASLEWQLHSYIFFYRGLPHVFIPVLFIVVYSGAFSAFYFFEKLITKGQESEINSREFILAFCITVFSFAFSNLSFVNSSLPFTSQSIKDIFNIRTLIDGMGLGILYAYQNHIEETRLKNELTFIQTILDNQYKNFQNYREGVDLVHIKYHDLKHQIEALRAEEDPEKRRQWINSMEKELELYEINFNTGNRVLDTILSSRQLLCKKYNIHSTYVIDGSRLDFITESDICSIFGNILDNAIEAVQQVTDSEKRLIHLRVSVQRSFIVIQCENYFTGKLSIENGIPQTHKENREYHGYGIKSIQYTVKKYNGNVVIEPAGNWFRISILIPAVSAPPA
jgi:hypothetical protein